MCLQLLGLYEENEHLNDEIKSREEQVEEMSKKCELCITLVEERVRAYDVLKKKYSAQQKFVECVSNALDRERTKKKKVNNEILVALEKLEAKVADTLSRTHSTENLFKSAGSNEHLNVQGSDNGNQDRILPLRKDTKAAYHTSTTSLLDDEQNNRKKFVEKLCEELRMSNSDAEKKGSLSRWTSLGSNLYTSSDDLTCWRPWSRSSEFSRSSVQLSEEENIENENNGRQKCRKDTAERPSTSDGSSTVNHCSVAHKDLTPERPSTSGRCTLTQQFKAINPDRPSRISSRFAREQPLTPDIRSTIECSAMVQRTSTPKICVTGEECSTKDQVEWLSTPPPPNDRVWAADRTSTVDRLYAIERPTSSERRLATTSMKDKSCDQKNIRLSNTKSENKKPLCMPNERMVSCEPYQPPSRPTTPTSIMYHPNDDDVKSIIEKVNAMYHKAHSINTLHD